MGKNDHPTPSSIWRYFISWFFATHVEQLFNMQMSIITHPLCSELMSIISFRIKQVFNIPKYKYHRKCNNDQLYVNNTSDSTADYFCVCISTIYHDGLKFTRIAHSTLFYKNIYCKTTFLIIILTNDDNATKSQNSSEVSFCSTVITDSVPIRD